jgi:hypothetical protein
MCISTKPKSDFKPCGYRQESPDLVKADYATYYPYPLPPMPLQTYHTLGDKGNAPTREDSVKGPCRAIIRAPGICRSPASASFSALEFF